MTIEFFIPLHFCFVSLSIPIPWLLVMVHPSQYLPAHFVAYQQICGPCPNFLLPAVSDCSREGNQRSFFAPGSGRICCASTGLCSAPGQLLEPPSSCFQSCKAFQLPVSQLLRRSGNLSYRHLVLYSAGRIDRPP